MIVLLLSGVALAECDTKSTPSVLVFLRADLVEQEKYIYDFEPRNMPEDTVIYSLTALDELSSFKFSKEGVFEFTPAKKDAGTKRLLLTAVNGTCPASYVLILDITARPGIIPLEPILAYTSMNQSQNQKISMKLDGYYENMTITWDLDDKPINGSLNNYSIVFNPGYKLSGPHNVTVRATNAKGISGTYTWYFDIGRVNRPPVLISPIPDFVLFRSTATTAYTLSDYFLDPEGAPLKYSYSQVTPTLTNITYVNLTVNLSSDTSVSYNPETNVLGSAYFVFNATDVYNKSAQSNVVKVDVIIFENILNSTPAQPGEYCGNAICGQNENCSSCPADCGLCEDGKLEGCRPEWNCTIWSACMPFGFQLRNCTDVNACEDNRTRPPEIRTCLYTATCDDNLKNGIEDGVDCGGPCEPCPSCSDGIQNQGEIGVDCGGICDPCPSCTDGVKNQNESDVDCGGQCSPCSGNRTCKANKDCESLRCEYLVCTFASCQDGIRNALEGGIDCGGSCEKECGTCTDGIQNQGENGVDCGGRCEPCPTCTDGKRNQGELFIDCGSSCRDCIFGDFIRTHPVIFGMIILLFIFLNALAYGYFFLLLARPEKARKLYDNNTFFAAMVELNRLTRPYRLLRGKQAFLQIEAYRYISSQLANVSKIGDIDSKQLYGLITGMYAQILGLAQGFDDHMLHQKAHETPIPLFIRVLFVGFYKKLSILLVDTFIPYEKKAEIIIEFKFLVSEMAKE